MDEIIYLANQNWVTDIVGNLTDGNTIQYNTEQVVSGSIILDKNIKVYDISTASGLTVTVNTGNVDMSKYVQLYLKIKLNDYVSLSFPNNFLFDNLEYPTEVGEYMYTMSSSDNGITWRLGLIYKNIATVGIDENGFEIIGSVIRYVDGDNGLDTNDGLSWTNSYKNIQTAIDLSNSGDAIFVKGSESGITYLPTTLRTIGDARSASFLLKTGINIFGGFIGTESSLYERDMVSYKEILRLPSGNIDLFVPVPKNKSIMSGNLLGSQITSSYTTLYCSSGIKSVVNGFQISDSFNDSIPYLCAGIHSSGTLILSNCQIINNIESYDYWYSSWSGVYGANLNNCLVSFNSSIGNINGGVGVINSSISNSIISSNVNTGTVNSDMGDRYGYSGSAGAINSSLTNCFISNNSTVGSVSAGFLSSFSNSDINKNISTAAKGTTLFISNLVNCSINSNESLNYLSYSAGSYNSNLISSIVYNNYSNGNVGGVSGGTLISCSIFNNYGASLVGGAESANLINCSVVRNSGGGTNNCVLKNTVVWGNKSIAGTQNNVVNTNSSIEEYSAFENDERPGIGNISISTNNSGDTNSPYFDIISLNSGVVDDVLVCNLNISEQSFLIDNGINSDNTSGYGSVFDVKSNNRISGTTIDIGAYEFQK